MSKPAEKKKNRANQNSATERPAVETGSLDELLGFHLRVALMELQRSYYQHVADGKIPAGLASLLQLVAVNPGASQIELARAIRIDKATLVAMVDRAEEAGWLNRVRSRQDRRRHELVLTPLGKSTARQLRQQILEHEKEFTERFTDRERQQLVEYLRRIYD